MFIINDNIMLSNVRLSKKKKKKKVIGNVYH